MQTVSSFEESYRLFRRCPLGEDHAKTFHEDVPVEVQSRGGYKPPVGHHKLRGVGDLHDELDVVVEPRLGDYRNRLRLDPERARDLFEDPIGSLRAPGLEALDGREGTEQLDGGYLGHRVN